VLASVNLLVEDRLYDVELGILDVPLLIGKPKTT